LKEFKDTEVEPKNTFLYKQKRFNFKLHNGQLTVQS